MIAIFRVFLVKEIREAFVTTIITNGSGEGVSA